MPAWFCALASSSLNWEAGSSTMISYCSFSVSCDSSSVGVDWVVLDFKLAN